MAFLAIASLLVPRRAMLAALAMGGLVAALVLWRYPDPGVRIGVLIPGLLLALGASTGHVMAGRRPRFWAGAGMAVLTVAVLTSLVDFDGWAGARDASEIWAAICLGLAGVIAMLLFALRGKSVGVEIAPPLAAGASGLVSIAIGLLVEPGYYALSAALQAAGLGLVFRRYRVRMLFDLALIYTGVYVALVVLGHAVTVEMAAVVMRLPYGQFIPAVAVDAAPWSTLVLPGLALLAAGSLFAWGEAERPVEVLDVVGVLALSLGIHLVLAPLAEGDPVRNVFVFGALWFPAQLGLAAAALWVAARQRRRGLRWGGTGIALFAALALIAWLIGPLATLWPEMVVPGMILINLATVTLGVSAVLLAVIGRLIAPTGGDAGRMAGRGFAALAGVAAFAWMLVTIRHGFHPELLQGETSRIERYAYTAGMLGFAFALLGLGTWRDARMVRFASLGVALVTVAKLFIFDLGELEGLWRIGSFLGLGIALLAVSWFYARFIFGMGREAREDEPAPAPA